MALAVTVAGRDGPRTLLESKGPGSGKRSIKRRCCHRVLSGYDLQRLWAYGLGPILCLVLLAGHIFLATRGTSSSSTSNYVAALSNSSFDDFVANNSDGALVNFYNTVCTHCHKFAPEFEAAAAGFEGNLFFASVNVDAEPELAVRYNVRRYPTVLWFRNGESVQELPPRTRTADKISEFVAWVRQPALIEFATRADLEDAVPTFRETLQSSLPPVICGFAGIDGSRAALEHAAEHLRGKTVFVFIVEAQEEGPFLRSFSHLEADDRTYEGPVSPDAVLQWVKSLLPHRDKDQDASMSD